MLERNSAPVFRGLLFGLAMQATNLAFAPPVPAMPVAPAPLNLDKGDHLWHEFFGFQGRNAASVQWVGQPASDAVRELHGALENFWDSFDDGSIFNVGADVRAAAERVGSLYPQLF